MGDARRRRRAAAMVTRLAIWAPALVGAGVVAHVAAAQAAAPAIVSVRWTGPDGQPVTSSGVPVTTTTVAGGTGDGTATPTTSGSAGAIVGSAPGSASLDQALSVSILPGPLTVSSAAESVAFSRAHGQGKGGRDNGALAPVTVVDARGSLVGWDATVTLRSVTGLDSSQLSRARLCIAPAAVTVIAGRPSEVRSGTRSCGGAGDPLTLFEAPANGGGGTFSDTCALVLTLPGTAAGNQVTASFSVAVH